MSKGYSDTSPGYYGGLGQEHRPRKKYSVAIYRKIAQLVNKGISKEKILDSHIGMSLGMSYEDIEDAIDMEERGLFEQSLTKEYSNFFND